MAPLEKLNVLAGQMALEPAEERDAAPGPMNVPAGGSVSVTGRRPDPSAAGPCGYSPAELQRALGKGEPGPSIKRNFLPVHHAVMPGGKRIALLKTLLTSACERDCYYCPFRAGRDMRRATFKPDEMAGAFAQMNRAGAV